MAAVRDGPGKTFDDTAAVLDSGSHPEAYDYLVKVIFVGNSHTGKTSLIAASAEESFSEEYRPTIGMDFKILRVTHQGKTFKLQIWDTAGQERFQSICRTYYRGARVAVVVFSLDDRASFEAVPGWIRQTKESSEAAIILIGNKSDVHPHCAVPEEIEDLVQAHELHDYIETSATTRDGVASLITSLATAYKDMHHETYGPPPPRVYGPPPSRRAQRPQTCGGGTCSVIAAEPASLAFAQPPELSPKTWPIVARVEELCTDVAAERSARFSECVRLCTPLVLRGVGSVLASNWPWKLTGSGQGQGVFRGLASRFGEQIVPIARLHPHLLSQPPFARELMPLKQFLQRTLLCEEGSRAPLYLQQVPLDEFLRDARKEFGIVDDGPRTISPASGAGSCAPTFFIGAQGTRTSLHYDRGDFGTGLRECRRGKNNVFCQLQGRKRFVLFSPRHSSKLYPGKGTVDPHVSRSHTAVSSMAADASVETAKEALSAWPKIASVWTTRLEIELGPGDALFIPEWWWHCTDALTDGIAVNWWF